MVTQVTLSSQLSFHSHVDPKNDVIIIMHIHSRADREMVTCGCGFTLHITCNTAAVIENYLGGNMKDSGMWEPPITLLDPRNNMIVI